MSSLDNDLLAQARSAATRRVQAEAALAYAKTSEQLAVRRLQLAGGSVRQIAKALGVSHQRIQQMIEAVDDGRGWKRRSKTAKVLICSFCAKTQDEVRKLVAGPAVYICDECIDAARTGFRPSEQCSFCGKHHNRNLTVRGANGFAVCRECLDLCDEIIAEELGEKPTD